MNFYEERILPHVIDRACSMGQIMKLRSQVVPEARGTVLEVGMGSAINLEFYNKDQVDRVYGLEPSHGMRRKARVNLEKSGIQVEWIDLPGERIPLDDQSVDTVLLTFTLCTIPDWKGALAQMYRVLKTGGELLFLEHGASPDNGILKWQNRLTPGWKKLAGGCHLNRNIAELIRQAGFEILELDNLYVPRAPKIAAYIYQGKARKPA